MQYCTYKDTDMIKQKHAKIIEKELIKLGSKIPEEMNLNLYKKHSLAQLLRLACGGGTYALKSEDIASIRNSEFSIDEDSVKKLCKNAPTRLGKS